MPAAQAQSYATAQPAERPQKRGNVRLVSDRSQQRARAVQQNALARACQTTFLYVGVAVALLVFLGLGSVFINAEATRCSQQSALIKADISQQTAYAQSLELKYATMRNSERIEKIATNDMGMVPAGNKVSAIDIGAIQNAPVHKNVSTPDKNSTLTRLAQLTTGEASALLVGDINLALSR